MIGIVIRHGNAFSPAIGNPFILPSPYNYHYPHGLKTSNNDLIYYPLME
jgi:hypothetical protein